MGTISSNGTGGGAWSATATWNGGAVPIDDDAVTIVAGDSVLMDADTSSFTGLRTVTITSHATTPGMLYFKDGTSGYLKLRTGYNIVGTNAAAKGRLLANSNGAWGGTTALTFASKAVIDLQGTAKIEAPYLDIALYCTEPTAKYVEVYKTAYTCTTQATDVNASTDVITFTGAPPSAGTAVKVRSSGTLPGGLTTTDLYYTRTVSGNTCKLALLNSDATIVDITSTGSGTLTMYDGHTDTGTATVNVIQDVTGDGPWITTDGHDRAFLCDIGPASADIQYATLVTINAGSIVLDANVDSAQYPLARLWLIARNVSVRVSHNAAGQFTFDYTGATHGGVLNCEIVNTAYSAGYHVYRGVGHTLNGCIGRGRTATYEGSGHAIGGVIAGSTDGASNGINVTLSGYAAGVQAMNGCKGSIVTGEVTGYVLFAGCVNCSFTGVALGNNSNISSSYDCDVGGVIAHCGTAISNSYNANLFGRITGCTTGVSLGSFTANSAVFSGNTTDVTLSGTSAWTGLLGRSFHHGGTANDTRAWCPGGSMTHETTEVPSGKSYSHKFTHTSASYWTVMEWELNRSDPLASSFVVYAKHDATSLAEAARLHWQLIDPSSDPLIGGTALAEWIAIDSTDWQSSTLTYTRTDDRPLLLRVCALRGSGNSYAYVDTPAGNSPRFGDRTGGLR